MIGDGGDGVGADGVAGDEGVGKGKDRAGLETGGESGGLLAAVGDAGHCRDG